MVFSNIKHAKSHGVRILKFHQMKLLWFLLQMIQQLVKVMHSGENINLNKVTIKQLIHSHILKIFSSNHYNHKNWHKKYKMEVMMDPLLMDSILILSRQKNVLVIMLRTSLLIQKHGVLLKIKLCHSNKVNHWAIDAKKISTMKDQKPVDILTLTSPNTLNHSLNLQEPLKSYLGYS